MSGRKKTIQTDLFDNVDDSIDYDDDEIYVNESHQQQLSEEYDDLDDSLLDEDVFFEDDDIDWGDDEE